MEELTKAAQTAAMLRQDIIDIYSRTENGALGFLVQPWIEQLTTMYRQLSALAPAAGRKENA